MVLPTFGASPTNFYGHYHSQQRRKRQWKILPKILLPVIGLIYFSFLVNSFVTQTFMADKKYVFGANTNGASSRILQIHHNAFGDLTASRMTQIYHGVKNRLFASVDQKVVAAVKHPLSAAVFLQVGYADLWGEMLMCATNVVAASTLKGYQRVDFYVSTVPASRPGSESNNNNNNIDISSDMLADLNKIPNIGEVFVQKFDNEGADLKPFMEMVAFNVKFNGNKPYDVILKMHTKGDNIWRERAIESLCATPEQVVSILRRFREDKALDMIVPQGTAFGPIRQKEHIFPHIVRKYNLTSIEKNEVDQDPVFDEGTKIAMNKIHKMMFPNGIPNVLNTNEDFGADKMMIAAGTMFWIRYSALNPQEVTDIIPKLSFTSGYAENLGVEHALERLFATEIVLRNRRIAEIPPAPRPVAMYFPQYHPFPENDRFWGKDFTEWTLLKPLELPNLRKPLSEEKGGLGYYNLMSKNTREKQADLAKNFGMNGFIYYHYWFSGDHAPKDHLVMHQVQEQILLDGEPDMPFAFSWANEPWTRRWTGGGNEKDKNEEVLLSQEYGDENEWREHFEYLLKFFKHPNYIRIQGKPLFILYRIGHIDSNLEPMVSLWRKLAVESGLPGIYLVNTIGNFRRTDLNTRKVEKDSQLDAAFHFWPQNLASFHKKSEVFGSETGSTRDIVSLLNTYPTQYWGTFTGFDRRPRDAKANPMLQSVSQFSSALGCSFEGMAYRPNREINKNLFFITAWNEWNEQAILEPDSTNKLGYLQSLSANLQQIPISIVSPELERKANAKARANILKSCLPLVG